LDTPRFKLWDLPSLLGDSRVGKKKKKQKLSQQTVDNSSEQDWIK